MTRGGIRARDRDAGAGSDEPGLAKGEGEAFGRGCWRKNGRRGRRSRRKMASRQRLDGDLGHGHQVQPLQGLARHAGERLLDEVAGGHPTPLGRGG